MSKMVTWPQFVERLGDAFSELPVMTNAPVGATGYLDMFEPSDLSAPVMRGQDETGRQFVALLINEVGDDCPQVGVVFQRYSDTDRVVASAGPWELTGGAMTEDEACAIARLVREREITRHNDWVQEETTIRLVSP